MRKVRYKVYESSKEHTGRFHEWKTGWFHEWKTEGPSDGLYVVAVIESDEGLIDLIRAHRVQFVDRSPITMKLSPGEIMRSPPYPSKGDKISGIPENKDSEPIFYLKDKEEMITFWQIYKGNSTGAQAEVRMYPTNGLYTDKDLAHKELDRRRKLYPHRAFELRIVGAMIKTSAGQLQSLNGVVR